MTTNKLKEVLTEVCGPVVLERFCTEFRNFELVSIMRTNPDWLASDVVRHITESSSKAKAWEFIALQLDRWERSI